MQHFEFVSGSKQPGQVMQNHDQSRRPVPVDQPNRRKLPMGLQWVRRPALMSQSEGMIKIDKP